MGAMHYLLYEKDGLLKKFPLGKGEVRIGRGTGNDIAIDEKAISKRHCRVRLEGEQLKIIDLGSRNGTFVENCPVSEARISLGQSFGAGGTEFYFKRGDPKEFRISKALAHTYAALTRSKRPESEDPDTELCRSRLELVLRSLAEMALQEEERGRFFERARCSLERVLSSGALFYRDARGWQVLANTPGISEKELGSAGFDSLPAQGSLSAPLPPYRYLKTASALEGAVHFLLYLFPREGGRNSTDGEFFAHILEIIEVQGRLTGSQGQAEGAIPSLYQDGEVAIVGSSPALKKVVDLAKRIAPKKSFVLLLGESGTGKELLAQMIHRLSGRRRYVPLNCAAIPSTLLESELFGYERGAFTDAKQRKTGKVEEAAGGTLVLDEVCELPLETQAKLLRVIQERSVTRLGGHELIPVDLRIVAMTNRNLLRLVEEGQFRQDLFYRLRVHQLTMPPLRERPEDIPHLIHFYVTQLARENRVVPRGFSESAEEILLHYSWPGNVRELKNEIHRIMEIIDDGELISDHHLLEDIVHAASRPLLPSDGPPRSPVRERLREAEKQEIERLLRQNGGNKMKTARELGMTYRGFLKKTKRLGIS